MTAHCTPKAHIRKSIFWLKSTEPFASCHAWLNSLVSLAGEMCPKPCEPLRWLWDPIKNTVCFFYGPKVPKLSILTTHLVKRNLILPTSFQTHNFGIRLKTMVWLNWRSSKQQEFTTYLRLKLAVDCFLTIFPKSLPTTDKISRSPLSSSTFPHLQTMQLLVNMEKQCEFDFEISPPQ